MRWEKRSSLPTCTKSIFIIGWRPTATGDISQTRICNPWCSTRFLAGERFLRSTGKNAQLCQERGFIGLRRFGEPADLSHKLERSRANPFLRGQRIEVEKRFNISAHRDALGLFERPRGWTALLESGIILSTLVTDQHSLRASVAAHPLKTAKRGATGHSHVPKKSLPTAYPQARASIGHRPPQTAT